MRFGAVSLGAFLVLAGLVSPGRARACSLAPPNLHTIDPTQVGVDQTPPQLGDTTVAELHNFDNDSGCSPKCGSDHGARLINLATDDMTPADRIGYRVTLVAGEAQYVSTAGRAIRIEPDGTFWLLWDGDDDFDFTVELIAIDEAGNESAPRTVRVSSGGGCSISGRRASGGLALAVVALALVSAAARPLRRRR